MNCASKLGAITVHLSSITDQPRSNAHVKLNPNLSVLGPPSADTRRGERNSMPIFEDIYILSHPLNFKQLEPTLYILKKYLDLKEM